MALPTLGLSLDWLDDDADFAFIVSRTGSE
jgi:hypothetical protein